MPRKYTMSEEALAVRRGKRKISDEVRKSKQEHMAKISAMNRKPPRVRVSVDKALAEQAKAVHGDLDKALEVSISVAFRKL